MGLHWMKTRRWLMAQAYIMPIPIIVDFLAWQARHIKPEIFYDDNRWCMYFFYHNQYVWVTIPSLVEHLGWNATTLNGGSYREGHEFEPRLRMAKQYIGFEKSAMDIDWTDEQVLTDNDGDLSSFVHYYIE